MAMQAFGFLPRVVGECVKQKKIPKVDVHNASCALWAAPYSAGFASTYSVTQPGDVLKKPMARIRTIWANWVLHSPGACSNTLWPV